jgi:hypothetical protein
MHETAITAAATIFFMLRFLLQIKARRYSLMPNGRRVLVSERQVVNNSGVPKIVYLCPYRRHHDPTRLIAEAKLSASSAPIALAYHRKRDDRDGLGHPVK